MQFRFLTYPMEYVEGECKQQQNHLAEKLLNNISY